MTPVSRIVELEIENLQLSFDQKVSSRVARQFKSLYLIKLASTEQNLNWSWTQLQKLSHEMRERLKFD